MVLPLHRTKEKLEEEIKSLKDSISTGPTDTWEHYHYKRGELRGLMRALETIKESEESYLNDED